VYMKLQSGRYGSFDICRYVRMYNVSDSANWYYDNAENMYYIAE